MNGGLNTEKETTNNSETLTKNATNTETEKDAKGSCNSCKNEKPVKSLSHNQNSISFCDDCLDSLCITNNTVRKSERRKIARSPISNRTRRATKRALTHSMDEHQD